MPSSGQRGETIGPDWEARPVIIPPAGLTGELIEPGHPTGLIILAYETHADWLRARRHGEAQKLAAEGFATLSLGLLHDAEARVASRLADVDFLFVRLLEAVAWAKQHPRLGKLRFGLIATRASVAAALRVAMADPQTVRAIVSRNGRPDLAETAAGRAAVLLVVSGEDEHLIGVNATALNRLGGIKRLEIVDTAGGIAGELDELGAVMEMAGEWFVEHLVRRAPLTRDGETTTPIEGAAQPPRQGASTMAMDESARDVREAVGVFDTKGALQDAIDELLSSGFDRADLSLLASVEAVEEKLGDRSSRRVELEDNPAAPRADYVSPEAVGAAEGGLIGGLAYLGGVAAAGLIAVAGGPLTAIVVGAAVAGGAGGLVGTRLAEVVGHRRARYFQRQVDRGGLLLWVRTWSPPQEAHAVEILARHSGRDVHVHGTPRQIVEPPRV
jgi:hypothetical protein